MLLADIFHTCYDYRKCPVNLEEVMIELVGDLLPKNFDSDICEDNEVIHIQVRRSMFLVDDALREGGKKKFVPGKKLKVTKDLTACFTWVICHERVLLYACVQVYIHVLYVGMLVPRWSLPLRVVWTREDHDVSSCAFWQRR